jgi:inosose dehydratase
VNADKVGHTAITWPFTLEGARQAIQDVGSLDYKGIELFGWVLDGYPGGMDRVRADLQNHGLRLSAAYCSASLIDASTRVSDVEKMVGWADRVRYLGGDVIVVGASPKQKPTYDVDEYRTLCTTLDEIGTRCLHLGVKACFHPHTGTPVETRDQIDLVMNGIDPRVVFMAPDTGQIAKGGGDPNEVVRTYREIVRHVHLKDWVGGESEFDERGELIDRTGYLDYVPLGDGVVDLPSIVATLEDAGFDGWWMVELDGTDHAPRPPKEASAASKRYLERFVYLPRA